MKGKITITRPSYGDGREVINIQVRDGMSRIKFLEVEIDLADFSKVLTGLSETDCKLSVKGLDKVGKVKVVQVRQAICPGGLRRKEELEQWLKENKQEEGWILDSYLGNKSSVEYAENGSLLRYQVIKYIEADNEQIS
ncbi:TPA: hypothetical protein PC505_002452 [Morganella morganii]|nr:hypothetical protein [Morganella morganii]HDF2364409.1 hypothetical protein [Morganella morganii]HDF2423031.1 hypothetical protein [Morganella morganii]